MDNEAHAKNLNWEHSDDGESIDRRRELSMLGQSLAFKGELEAEEDLMIDGRVEGKITHRAQQLTIGPHGNVKADVVANRVLIQGSVVGNIRAAEAIVIEPSAHVAGNLFAPRIGLKEGAEFDGQIQMTRKPADTAKAEAGETSLPSSTSKPQPVERGEARAAGAAKPKTSPKKPGGTGGMNDASVDDLLE